MRYTLNSDKESRQNHAFYIEKEISNFTYLFKFFPIHEKNKQRRDIQ